jgi:hypothetical protein
MEDRSEQTISHKFWHATNKFHVLYLIRYIMRMLHELNAALCRSPQFKIMIHYNHLVYYLPERILHYEFPAYSL